MVFRQLRSSSACWFPPLLNRLMMIQHVTTYPLLQTVPYLNIKIDEKKIIFHCSYRFIHHPLPNLMTCLFIFLIVRWRTSHKYILVKSMVISLENIHVATAEHSTICVLSNLSITTHNICWWLPQSSYTLCNKQICASSESAIAYRKMKVRLNSFKIYFN